MARIYKEDFAQQYDKCGARSDSPQLYKLKVQELLTELTVVSWVSAAVLLDVFCVGELFFAIVDKSSNPVVISSISKATTDTFFSFFFCFLRAFFFCALVRTFSAGSSGGRPRCLHRTLSFRPSSTYTAPNTGYIREFNVHCITYTLETCSISIYCYTYYILQSCPLFRTLLRQESIPNREVSSFQRSKCTQS